MKPRCLLLCANAIAHTGLKSSSPSHEAELTQSPKKITLTFNAQVRLIKLDLKNVQGIDNNLAFKASKKPASTFQQAIPSNLSKGTYTIKWVAISRDGHKVKGVIRFNIKSNAVSAGETATTYNNFK